MTRVKQFVKLSDTTRPLPLFVGRKINKLEVRGHCSRMSIEWVIGTFVALAGLIGGSIVRDRHVFRVINAGDEKLHERLNKVQAEYVRRDDLNGHIQALENSINQMAEQQRETNRRIDALLTAMTNSNKR